MALGRLKIFLYFILLLLILVVIWVACNVRLRPADGQPLVEVSSETTWLTAPLDSNGDVDYLEAVNIQCSDGVTLENNAFAKLIRVIGPIQDDPELTNQIVERLGIEPLAPSGDYFVEFETWLRNRLQQVKDQKAKEFLEKSNADLGSESDLDSEHLGGSEDWSEDAAPDPEDVLEQFEFAQQFPWSKQQFPEVEEWRKRHEPMLQLIREGVQRSHYYHPLASKQSPKLMNATLHYPLEIRKLGDLLSVSTMSKISEGDVDGCIDDLNLHFGLAFHVARGPSLVEELVGITIANGARDDVVSLCASGKADALQLKRLAQCLKEAKPIDNCGQRIDLVERLVGLDAAVSMARANGSARGVAPSVEAQVSMLSQIVAWEETLSTLNGFYGRFKEAAMSKDPDEFQAVYSSLEDEMIENDVWVNDNTLKAGLMGRKSRGIWLGRLLGGTLMPGLGVVVKAENETKSKHEMLKILVAASIFKIEKNVSPESLDQLAPEYLDRIPNDPLTGQAFVLKLTDHGLQIHSPQWDEESDLEGRLMLELKSETWETWKIANEEDDLLGQ